MEKAIYGKLMLPPIKLSSSCARIMGTLVKGDWLFQHFNWHSLEKVLSTASRLDLQRQLDLPGLE